MVILVPLIFLPLIKETQFHKLTLEFSALKSQQKSRTISGAALMII
jgi:hypothetical protein